MSEESGQVTLIFYKLNNQWWKEPFLNILAAAAQFSSFTHVELAIGTDAGVDGSMTNVCRIFNDQTGVELTARTGRTPQCVIRIELKSLDTHAHLCDSDDCTTHHTHCRRYSYLQLGCSKTQEQKMLRFAKSCVGRPFSGTAMARSVIWPRKTTNVNFFCAGTMRPCHSQFS
jgi:hypothetical protein